VLQGGQLGGDSLFRQLHEKVNPMTHVRTKRETCPLSYLPKILSRLECGQLFLRRSYALSYDYLVYGVVAEACHTDAVLENLGGASVKRFCSVAARGEGVAASYTTTAHSIVQV
jgi:hypothetical protein